MVNVATSRFLLESFDGRALAGQSIKPPPLIGLKRHGHDLGKMTTIRGIGGESNKEILVVLGAESEHHCVQLPLQLFDHP